MSVATAQKLKNPAILANCLFDKHSGAVRLDTVETIGSLVGKKFRQEFKADIAELIERKFKDGVDLIAIADGVLVEIQTFNESYVGVKQVRVWRDKTQWFAAPTGKSKPAGQADDRPARLELIRFNDNEAVCWVEVSPGTQVKASIPRAQMKAWGMHEMTPGMKFDNGKFIDAPLADQATLDELARLSREFRDELSPEPVQMAEH